MIIKGFWHIFMVNNYYSVITDQLRILLTSGLYDACEEISIGCIGSPAERHLFEMYFINANYPKLKFKYHSEVAEEFEFPTLSLIEADDSHYVGFYFHTKGASRPFETVVQHWRAYMNEMILNRWQEHRDRVDNDYDVSSLGYLPQPNHFSGNFWWFNRSYISRCPPIISLNHKNRFHAEQWICMGKPNFYSIPHTEPGDAIFKIQYK